MSDSAPRINLLIGTPAYNCQVHTEYVRSLLAFQKAAIPYSLLTIGNESLITRARNTILSRFFASERYTHLFFLDGDIGLSVEGLNRLLSHGCDVIGAQVPLKKLGEDGERTYNVGARLETNGLLAKVEHVGTAVLLLSRKAVDALVEDARSAGRTYAPPYETEGESGGVHFDVFRVGVETGVYLSEDYWICHWLRRLGHDIHVDLSVKPTHHGMYAF